MRPKLFLIFLPLLLPLGILGSWVLATSSGWVPTSLLAAPFTVLQTAWVLAASGELWTHVVASLVRVLVGFTIGAGCGVLLGIGLGLNVWARALLRPSITAFQQIPLFAWMPLLIVLLGIEESSKIVFIAVGCFFPAWINTYEGMTSLPVSFHEVAAVYGLDPARKIQTVSLPWAVPSIIAGLRLSFSLAWMLVVGAELFGSDSGIGYLMTWGRQMFQIDIVLVGVALIGLIGISVNQLFAQAENRLLRWRQHHASQ